MIIKKPAENAGSNTMRIDKITFGNHKAYNCTVEVLYYLFSLSKVNSNCYIDNQKLILDLMF
ncbi:hypothetical protein B9J85_04310 [Vibrio sp. V11_P1A41T118]|nr:hypothetical protein B9J85_04310 [Vibrio sp. V11_P1A41T118]